MFKWLFPRKKLMAPLELMKAIEEATVLADKILSINKTIVINTITPNEDCRKRTEKFVEALYEDAHKVKQKLSPILPKLLKYKKLILLLDEKDLNRLIQEIPVTDTFLNGDEFLMDFIKTAQFVIAIVE